MGFIQEEHKKIVQKDEETEEIFKEEYKKLGTLFFRGLLLEKIILILDILGAIGLLFSSLEVFLFVIFILWLSGNIWASLVGDYLSFALSENNKPKYNWWIGVVTIIWRHWIRLPRIETIDRAIYKRLWSLNTICYCAALIWVVECVSNLFIFGLLCAWVLLIIYPLEFLKIWIIKRSLDKLANLADILKSATSK